MNEALRDWVTNVARHLLLHRHGRGAASLSDDGARLPVDHRRRDPRSRCRRPKAGCRTRWSPASAAAPTPWACSIPSSTIRRWRSTASRPAGHGLDKRHAASLTGGRPGVLHGNRTYLLMNDDGQILEAHSISAGLDYPGIGPEHSWLHDIGRVDISLRDRRGGARGVPAAARGSKASSRRWNRRMRSRRSSKLAPSEPKDHLMVVNLSGRGDKDMPQVGDILKGRKK